MRDYDTQLLESVAVRRRRLRDASMFGAMRARRTLDQNLGKAFIGVVVAAVICAGCVGWSFIQKQRILQQRQQQQEQRQQPGVPSRQPGFLGQAGLSGQLPPQREASGRGKPASSGHLIFPGQPRVTAWRITLSVDQDLATPPTPRSEVRS